MGQTNWGRRICNGGVTAENARSAEGRQTVETVGIIRCTANTSLKRGVNERAASWAGLAIGISVLWSLGGYQPTIAPMPRWFSLSACWRRALAQKRSQWLSWLSPTKRMLPLLVIS